jgi:hypothetical protein
MARRGLKRGIPLEGRVKPWMHEIFEDKVATVQSNARIVKLRIKFAQRKISLSQTVNRTLAWIQSCQILSP